MYRYATIALFLLVCANAEDSTDFVKVAMTVNCPQKLTRFSAALVDPKLGMLSKVIPSNATFFPHFVLEAKLPTKDDHFTYPYIDFFHDCSENAILNPTEIEWKSKTVEIPLEYINSEQGWDAGVIPLDTGNVMIVRYTPATVHKYHEHMNLAFVRPGFHNDWP